MKRNSFQGTLLPYARVFPIPEKLAKLDLQPGMGMNFMYILEYYLAVLGDARGKDLHRGASERIQEKSNLRETKNYPSGSRAGRGAERWWVAGGSRAPDFRRQGEPLSL